MPCTESESCCSGRKELPAGTSEPKTQPPCESHTLSTSQGCCADGRSCDGEEAPFSLLVPWTDALRRCMHPRGCNAGMPEFLWTKAILYNPLTRTLSARLPVSATVYMTPRLSSVVHHLRVKMLTLSKNHQTVAKRVAARETPERLPRRWQGSGSKKGGTF